VNFSEQPASKQWAALNYRRKKLAEVWFKPEGEPLGLTFRVPRGSFETPGVGHRLRLEDLLKAVGITADQVEAWRFGGVAHSSRDTSALALEQPLPAPPSGTAHLEIHISLRRPAETADPERAEPPAALTKEQGLEARWSTILGVEAGIDSARIGMERLRVEMEATWKKTLSPEERLHAMRADVHLWNKSKARVPHALPKIREFVHRATWVMGTPERKKVAELFKNHAENGTPLPELDRLSEELESLLKDRQVLAAQGVSVHQECKSIVVEIQAALRTLQTHAAMNARRDRDAHRKGGKFFKDVRKWTTGGG
jgi:hypothetical protein